MSKVIEQGKVIPFPLSQGNLNCGIKTTETFDRIDGVLDNQESSSNVVPHEVVEGIRELRELGNIEMVKLEIFNFIQDIRITPYDLYRLLGYVEALRDERELEEDLELGELDEEEVD